jgi:hypothetical protein
MAAVMRLVLTGNAPLPATTRVVLDAMAPLRSVGVADTSAHLLGAIDWALAVRPQDRPQSIAQWRDALDGRVALPPLAAAALPAAGADGAAPAPWAETMLRTLPAAVPAPRRSRRWWPWLAAGVLVFGFGVLLAFVITPPADDVRTAAPSAAPATAAGDPPAVVERPPPGAPAPPPTDAAPAASPPTAKATQPRLPESPRDACGERVLVAMVRCMMRECERPRFANHPQCVRLQEQQARRREQIERTP